MFPITTSAFRHLQLRDNLAQVFRQLLVIALTCARQLEAAPSPRVDLGHVSSLLYQDFHDVREACAAGHMERSHSLVSVFYLIALMGLRG